MGKTLERVPEVACGVDIVELGRLGRAIEVGGDRFLKRVYTEQELLVCAGKLHKLAMYFAAKEAITKVLGTGLRGIHLYDIEIVSNQGNPPLIQLHGRVARLATQFGISNWTISLAHCRTLAIACAVTLR